VDGSKRGYTTIQSKERIVLMETKSPASTNGDFMLNPEKADQEPGPMVLLMPSHAYQAGYLTENPEDNRFETVMLEFDPKTHTVTHPSATAGYAVFRTDCIAQGIPSVSYAAWLRTANLHVQKELTEKHHLQS